MARMVKLSTTVTPATIATIDRESKRCGVSRGEWLRHFLAVQCASMDYAEREPGWSGLTISLPDDVMAEVRKQATAEGVSDATWIQSTVKNGLQSIEVDITQPEFEKGEMETLGLVQSEGTGEPVRVGPGGLSLPLGVRLDGFGFPVDADPSATHGVDMTGLTGATVIPSVADDPAYPVVECSEEDLRRASETVRKQILGECPCGEQEKGDES